MGTLLMSIILSQICRLGKSIRIYYIQIICDSDYNKAYAWYILTLSAIAICYLWENYPAFSIYRVSTYVVYKNTMKYKKMLIYHTGEKSVIHNLCYYKTYRRGKLYQCSTNEMQGLYHTGECSSYKMQVLSHMGENKLFYIIFCDENHRSRKPYLVNYLTKYYK